MKKSNSADETDKALNKNHFCNQMVHGVDALDFL